MTLPVIPPDRAFAVDGVVDRRVRATLAEARRIRDAWADAVHDAQVAARASAATALRGQLEALAAYRQALAQAQETQAHALALRLARGLLGAHFAATPEAVEAQLDALVSARPDWIEVRVPPGTPLDGAALADLRVHIDPALRPGELILEGPNGTVDARFGARLARLDSK